MNQYVILGTAGHIDHGKSALVNALTGIDPDRLKEEKERGITIDLGFAFLRYPDNLNVGIVDVPGHEKLIKNMLAGAGGIDLVLLVIAADEGIMPQSREHLAICNLLNIKKGLIAVTKSDLVEKDWLALITEEVKDFVKGTFLEGAEIIQVSSKTGDNIDTLKEKIRAIASGIEPKPVRSLFRIPVDRVFNLKGFGTVITGTTISGSVSVEDPVEILPSGIKTKVRGLQSHGTSLKTVYAGQRAAINLQGVEKEDVLRGDVLTVPGKITSTSAIDAKINLLKDISITKLKNRSLVHFYTGTSELTARIVLYDNDSLTPGDSAYCQFRLKAPIAVMAGDRYIIRRFSPLLTIGGGEVIDPSPRHRRKKDGCDDLKILERGSLEEKLSMKIFHSKIDGTTAQALDGWIKAELPDINSAIRSLMKKNEVISLENRLLHREFLEDFSGRVISTVENFHKKNPLRPGLPKETLRASFKWLTPRFFEALLASIQTVAVEKDIIRLKTFEISLSEDKKLMKDRITKILEQSAFQPPGKEELAKKLAIDNKEMDELLKIMASEGSLIRINDTLYLSSGNYRKMLDGLRAFFKRNPAMTVAEFRDILGTTRKFALPFLEYLDSNKITLRVGEARKFLIKQNDVS